MDSRIVLIARKQPTAAKAPESSASSSVSELAIHLQKAAAYHFKAACFIRWKTFTEEFIVLNLWKRTLERTYQILAQT